MNALLQWHALAEVSQVDRAGTPVSVALLPDGERVIVSRFADDVWNFYPYIPQENLSPGAKTVSWAIAMPDGRSLTDPIHRQLLESAKAFVWAGFMCPPEGRPRPKALTVIKNVRHLTPLLRWMVDRGFKRFADIGDKAIEYVPVARLSAHADRRGTEATPDTVSQRLMLVEDLFRQRDKLQDALVQHPWPLETACALAGLKQHTAHRSPKTEFIPDDVVAPLAKVALEYVQQRAPMLLDAMEAANASAREAAKQGATKSRQADARTATARKNGFAGFYGILAELIRLRTACYIIIDLFSGLRDSEMMSIEEGCIRSRTGADGSTEQLWLHGTIYKTGIRPKRWLVPPVVQEAVEVLTRLTAPQRRHLRQEHDDLPKRIDCCPASERGQLVRRLTLVTQQRHKLFLGMHKGSRYGGPSALTGAVLNHDLKNFCLELGIVGADSKPYPLHAHQFRRTYARWVAKAELGDLLYLRDHFGHCSVDMTVFYADGGADEYQADSELLELISQEKLTRQNEVIGRYLTTDERLANGGHWLMDWRRTVQTAKNKEALVAEYAGTITLNGTGHSWCIGNARGVGCGGLCMMQAQMCVDCSYGVIGQEHRPVWEGIRDQQLEALALGDMGPGGKARAEEILHKAEKVLGRLDGRNAE